MCACSLRISWYRSQQNTYPASSAHRFLSRHPVSSAHFLFVLTQHPVHSGVHSIWRIRKRGLIFFLRLQQTKPQRGELVRTPASDTLQIRDCNEIIFIYQSNTLLFFVGITGTELTSLKFYFNTFMLVHNVCILLQITSNIISFKILINLCYRLNLFCYFSAYKYKKFARPKTPCSAFFKMTYFFHQDLFVTSVNNGSFNHNFSDLSGKLRKRPAKLQLMVHLYLFDDISSIYIYT